MRRLPPPFSRSRKKGAATKPANAKPRPDDENVKYNGYPMQVPSSWPVYPLDKDPRQCVRYDINAVYLGTPSPNQNCPPGLIGQADTVSIGGPPTPGQPTTPVRTDLRASVGDGERGPNMPARPEPSWRTRACVSTRSPCPTGPSPSAPPTGPIQPRLASAGQPAPGHAAVRHQHGRADAIAPADHRAGCRRGDRRPGQTGQPAPPADSDAAGLYCPVFVLDRADAYRDRRSVADAHWDRHAGAGPAPPARWRASTPAPPRRCRR